MQLNNCYGGFYYLCGCLFGKYYSEPEPKVHTTINITNNYYTHHAHDDHNKQNTSTNLNISDLIKPIEYYSFLQNT